MKRLLILFLCLALMLPVLTSAEEIPDVPIVVPVEQDLTPVNAVVPDFSQLVIASTTPMNGEFFTSMWGNNTADIDVRLLLHDANTVAWQNEGAYGGNMNILTDLSAAENTANGEHTYTFVLRDDLKFSDGSALTAKDYVFSVLLQSSPQIAGLGVTPSAYADIKGWEAFSTGASTVFSGVRLLSDNSFSLTISGDSLPYFYELSLVSVAPYPISVLAPGCDVDDTGNGASLTGDFTTELLEKTICDPQTGYRFHPSVTTGPYTLVSYDAQTNEAVFELNAYYAGNYEGQLAVIPRIVFRAVKNDEIMPLMATGEINLVNKVSQGEVINTGLAGVANEEYSMAYYLRAGLSFIAFNCDNGLTASTKIRQALMHCVDPQAMVDGFLLGYGQTVYGMYGYGQWMVNTQTEALEELNLYPYDTAAAIAYFIEEGYTFNAAGGDYTEGIRYNSEGKPLAFTMAKTADNAAADAAEALLREAFAIVGADLVVDTMPAGNMLAMYYRQTENPYDLMFMATNFTFTFDPYYTYHTDPAYAQFYNTSGLKDEKLMQLADEMRRTEPDDMDTYIERWTEFQKYWVTVVPFLPLYSNIYFDFYSPYLEEYNIASYSSWASAIVYANFDDVMTPPEEVPLNEEEVVVP